MRKLTLVLATLTLLVTASPVLAEGHVNFFLGQKSLDSGDWDPVDKQPEFGAIMSFGGADWPVFIAVDVMTSASEEDVYSQFGGSATFTAATIEGAFGLRKIWNVKNTHPYIGGGFALISAGAEYESFGFIVDADGTAIGPWVSGGVFWRLGKRFNLGFDVRWSHVEVDLEFDDGAFFVPDTRVKAGGLHGGLTLGFGW